MECQENANFVILQHMVLAALAHIKNMSTTMMKNIVYSVALAHTDHAATVHSKSTNMVVVLTNVCFVAPQLQVHVQQARMVSMKNKPNPSFKQDALTRAS
jgi:hypothetical protein